jgi:hypothetical protein
MRSCCAERGGGEERHEWRKTRRRSVRMPRRSTAKSRLQKRPCAPEGCEEDMLVAIPLTPEREEMVVKEARDSTTTATTTLKRHRQDTTLQPST